MVNSDPTRRAERADVEETEEALHVRERQAEREDDGRDTAGNELASEDEGLLD